MPPAGNGQGYVCLPCLLRSTRPQTARQFLRLEKPLHQTRKSTIHSSVSSRKQATATQDGPKSLDSTPDPTSKTAAESSASATIEINEERRSILGNFHRVSGLLKEQLNALAKTVPEGETISLGSTIEKVYAQVDESQHPFLKTIQKEYSGESAQTFMQGLDRIAPHRRPSAKLVENPDTISILKKLGIVKDNKSKATEKSASKTDKPPLGPKATGKLTTRAARRAARARRKVDKTTTATQKQPVGKVLRKVSNLAARFVQSAVKVAKETASKQPTPRSRAMNKYAAWKAAATPPPPTDVKSVDSSFIRYEPVTAETAPKVPTLSFDLSRVQFNPGIYHLQDPRSRVYNFDPYLENIMPVTEFNFDALNPYVTSSADTFLRDVSMKHQKRYIGSSSSMSGAMSQFHFLLSAWRPISYSILSQRFVGNLNNFTTITRTPASIFLRWRDGVYAIDSDKEHDEPNVLMMQGKAMEKLLTLEKDEFEKYRKPKAGESAPAVDTEPEAYHYSTVDKFLLRSQLDAYDPRLPGTGTFDLKTRSVAGIRMLMSEHESGMTYEIKDRFGMWESYDREYYDMIRSAFLKYSMQVRMGRMDGIFVAYHNIARIFGFQYISLPELDMALHGQPDTVLGDREFRLTLKLMAEIFDEASQVFPEQSLRMTFDTKEAVKENSAVFMRIYAEPMPENVVKQTQNSSKERLDEYEKAMAQGVDLNKPTPSPPRTFEEFFASGQVSPSTLESNAADIGFLDSILNETTTKDDKPKTQNTVKGQAQEQVQERPVIGYELHIWNEVNGKNVLRPTDMASEDRWIVKYKLVPMQSSITRASLNRSRSKRASALAKNDKEGPFQRLIRQMNESGREWRAEQDELDARRGKVTLYNV